VELAREALGAPELPVEVENVQRWNACAEWAERFQAGRVFLTGDAAHNMPPTGGFGGNAGVQDGHNLAWKLALVLHGLAGPELLETYDAERRPVGEFTVEQAYTRYVLRLAPELGKDNLQPIVPEFIVELGYRYRSPAVIEEDGADGASYENPHEPTAQPGTRAPHLVLQRGGEPVSTLDLPGPGFVLLASQNGEDWCAAARDAASRLGITLDAYRIGDGGELDDAAGRFSEVYGTGPKGAVLLRPDGFVAWRRRGPGDTAELGDALAAILARPV
jgi:hypothetical protein